MERMEKNGKNGKNENSTLSTQLKDVITVIMNHALGAPQNIAQPFLLQVGLFRHAVPRVASNLMNPARNNQRPKPILVQVEQHPTPTRAIYAYTSTPFHTIPQPCTLKRTH
jgi:hypothetical protein